MKVVIDPQQELFTRLLIDLKKLGYDVYDGFLPPENTPYPFVYLGDCQQVDDTNKSAIFGSVHQTIHVWHNNPMQRGTVSKMLMAIRYACRDIERTDNHSWFIASASQRILPDNTTKQPLLHGVVEVEFRFS